MKALLQLLIVLSPWWLKRHLLRWGYGYELHADSRIGFAWVFPRRLVMGAGSRIGHLTVCKGLDRLVLGEKATIGRLNWISAYPTSDTAHFAHLRDREAVLELGEHAAITNRHIVDCTERVSIGRFATVAGFRSQILTHSIDLSLCRQDAKPVRIGEYCFVGTACTILGGGVLPDHSVLGAHALLSRPHAESHTLYGGVPAVAMKKLDRETAYFIRKQGFVT